MTFCGVWTFTYNCIICFCQLWRTFEFTHNSVKSTLFVHRISQQICMYLHTVLHTHNLSLDTIASADSDAGQYFYLDARRTESGAWAWASNGKRLRSYNWGSDSPRNFLGIENCIVIHKDSGKWSDESCHKLAKAICQYP